MSRECAGPSHSRLTSWASLGLILAIIALVIACTPRARHDVLTFFFDGVPEPGSSSAPSPTLAGLMTEPMPGEDSPLDSEINWASVHLPYLEEQCDACHLGELTDVLVATDQSQCLRCHGDRVIEEQWNHGPAALGQCRVCHEAHVSVQPHLLVVEQPRLCTECHSDSSLMARVDEHLGQISQSCTACHDPHRLGEIRH